MCYVKIVLRKTMFYGKQYFTEQKKYAQEDELSDAKCTKQNSLEKCWSWMG